MGSLHTAQPNASSDTEKEDKERDCEEKEIAKEFIS